MATSLGSIGAVLETYNATLDPGDLDIFKVLKYERRKELETLPLFGPKRAKQIPTQSNPLLAHSARATALLTSISNVKAFNTALQYDEGMANAPKPSGFYDLRFLLPALCHVLDEKNICDVVKVVQHGWIFLIMRGISLKDHTLRKASFLAFKRLLFNLQQAKISKNQDVKIWVHFLLAIRRGISELGQCQVSHLLSTWLVAAWEVLRQPSHPMFFRLTTFLLAKPVIDMNIVPEFIPFFNASDGNKDSRQWILNVLYWGLKTHEDWKIAQKLPTIKFLCSSFLLENLKTKKNIIGILNRGARIPDVAKVMVDKYSLPLWIANIVTNDAVLKMHLDKLYHSLKSNCPSTPSRDSLMDFVYRKMEYNKELVSVTEKYEEINDTEMGEVKETEEDGEDENEVANKNVDDVEVEVDEGGADAME